MAATATATGLGALAGTIITQVGSHLLQKGLEKAGEKVLEKGSEKIDEITDDPSFLTYLNPMYWYSRMRGGTTRAKNAVGQFGDVINEKYGAYKENIHFKKEMKNVENQAKKDEKDMRKAFEEEAKRMYPEKGQEKERKEFVEKMMAQAMPNLQKDTAEKKAKVEAEHKERVEAQQQQATAKKEERKSENRQEMMDNNVQDWFGIDPKKDYKLINQNKDAGGTQISKFMKNLDDLKRDGKGSIFNVDRGTAYGAVQELVGNLTKGEEGSKWTPEFAANLNNITTGMTPLSSLLVNGGAMLYASPTARNALATAGGLLKDAISWGWKRWGPKDPQLAMVHERGAIPMHAQAPPPQKTQPPPKSVPDEKTVALLKEERKARIEAEKRAKEAETHAKRATEHAIDATKRRHQAEESRNVPNIGIPYERYADYVGRMVGAVIPGYTHTPGQNVVKVNTGTGPDSPKMNTGTGPVKTEEKPKEETVKRVRVKRRVKTRKAQEREKPATVTRKRVRRRKAK